MKQLRIFIKEPEKNGYVSTVNDNYKDLQKIVGGYLESVPLHSSRKITLLCDEEGKLKNKKPNLYFMNSNDTIVGTVIFVSYNSEGEFKSLTDKQIRFLEEKFNSIGGN